MSPLEPGDLVRIENKGDIAMDAAIRPYIGELLDVEKVAKSGLIVLTLPSGKGTISLPRSCLTVFRIAAFHSPGGRTKRIDSIQVYEDKYPN